MQNKSDKTKISRRQLLRHLSFGFCAVTGFYLLKIKHQQHEVWQLDPAKCIQCGNCATACVLNPSAVKCVHIYKRCGYCDLCSGFFIQSATHLDTAAENQLCPANALKRSYIEEPYFEYTIDESLCLGCGRCVQGCTAFGNGSLILQVRHDRCVDCNQCAIAKQCPAKAFQRVPAEEPYFMDPEGKTEKA
ncbi:4Fe-4S binding protein [Candidatus Riflebacteria bacterium]